MECVHFRKKGKIPNLIFLFQNRRKKNHQTSSTHSIKVKIESFRMRRQVNTVQLQTHMLCVCRTLDLLHDLISSIRCVVCICTVECSVCIQKKKINEKNKELQKNSLHQMHRNKSKKLTNSKQSIALYFRHAACIVSPFSKLVAQNE